MIDIKKLSILMLLLILKQNNIKAMKQKNSKNKLRNTQMSKYAK
jgi:hypothetical protein